MWKYSRRPAFRVMVEQGTPSWWRKAAGALAAIALLFVLIGGADAATSQRPIFVRSGHMGPYHWWAGVEAPELAGQREAGYVCPVISVLEPAASGRLEGQLYGGCSPRPTSRPIIQYATGGYGGRHWSVVTLVFPANVRTVKVKARGGPVVTLRADHVSAPGPVGGPSVPVALAAKGFARNLCIERVVALGADGTSVSTLGRQPCA
jgi:hypothetical protein